MKKKVIAVLMCMTMVIGLAACGNAEQEATKDPAPAAEETTEEAAAEEAQTAAKEEAPAEEASTAAQEEATAEEFNPDTETDTITYAELEEKFGPVPEVTGEVTIGSILKNNANEAWLTMADGMEKAAEDYGISIDIQATRTETDTAGQLSIAETMLANEYDSLVLSPLTKDNLNSAVQTALGNDTPVVNMNCEYIAQCDTFVGGIQIEIGRKSADYIAEKIGEKGKVAILEGVSGTFTSIQRVNGFLEGMEKYPDIEIVASQTADYEVEKGMDVASNILTQTPDIDAFYCCNDNMALGAVEALRSVNKVGEVIVVGVDGTGDAYASIKKGEMTATVDQFLFDNGYAAVEVALRIMGGQELPKVVSTPIEVLDAENMAEYGK